MESRDAVVQLTWVGVVPAVCEHARTQERKNARSQRSGAECSACAVEGWKAGAEGWGGVWCVCVGNR